MNLRHVFTVFVLWLVLFGPRAACAQGELLESEYWARLRQTGQLLRQDTAQDDTIAQIQQLWQGVDTVRLADGDIVALDLRWLTVDLTPAKLRETSVRVHALLDYHNRRAGRPTPDVEGRLAALDKVRLDYPEPTQVPDVGPSPRSTRAGQPGSLPAGLSQFVLFVLAIGVVLAVLSYFARGLQIQRTASGDKAGDEDDVPVTSVQARERAAASETTRDYRAAMRYLYLSSLLRLDERGIIVYDPTLTNREHIRQVSGRPQVANSLRPVVNTFDRVWYGFAPLDQAQYEEFRHSVDRLMQLTP